MGMKFPQNGLGMKFPQTIRRNCILFIILHPVYQTSPVDVQRRGQTDRGYKKPVTNTDIEIAIPLGMKRIPDSVNQYSFRYKTDTG